MVPASGLTIQPGDTDGDCRVSLVDVQTIANQWGLKWGDTGYGLVSDVDQDGEIKASDLQAAAANWRVSGPSPCNAAVTKYYRLGNRVVALRQNGQLRYVHGDHLGSVSLLTDETGQVVPGSVQRFMPFGKVRAGQPAILPIERNFTGQRLDLNTGLLYYANGQGYGRYYDPALGRFAQPDILIPNPGNPQDLNRYVYSRNNPLRYIDPSGHWPGWVDFVLGSGYQFANDMAWGLPDLVGGTEWQEEQSAAFQQGQEVGRAASTAAGMALTVNGSTTTLAGLNSIPPTMAAAAVCAGATGGLCSVPRRVLKNPLMKGICTLTTQSASRL